MRVTVYLVEIDEGLEVSLSDVDDLRTILTSLADARRVAKMAIHDGESEARISKHVLEGRPREILVDVWDHSLPAGELLETYTRGRPRSRQRKGYTQVYTTAKRRTEP